MEKPPLLLSESWTRSNDGWLAGVCEGIGHKLDLNPGLIRLFWVGSILFFGIGFLLYFIFAFCLPVEGREYEAKNSKILGVCLRLSDKLDIDVGLLRVLTVLVAIGSFGATFLFYILLHFLLDKQSHNRPDY